MSTLVVDRVGSFFNSLVLRANVLSLSDNGTNTILALDNVFNARTMPTGYERTVTIDSIEYTVLSVDYSANSIQVAGVIASASIAIFPNPYYLYGTLLSASNEFKQLEYTQTKNVPLVYLNEVVNEELPEEGSLFETIAKIRLVYLDVYDPDWGTREQHYDNTIRPLLNLAGFVKNQLDNYAKCLSRQGKMNQRAVPRWGRYNRKGTEEKIFDGYLDAVEWEFELGICNCP